MKRKIEPGEPVTVRMSRRDRELIETLAGGDPDYAARLRAIATKPYLAGEYTLDELDDLLGFIAAEANHTDDSRVKKQLDALYDRLLAVQRSYDDGNWQDSAG